MPGVERASAPAAESLYVPNLAVDFAVAVRAARYFAFRLEGGFAAPESAMPAGAAAEDRPADAVGHGGFGILFMIPFDDPRSSVHITLDQSIFFLPARVCEPGGECGRTTTMQMLVLEGGVYASHAPIRELRITGGAALRNQPLFGAAFGGASDASVGFGDVALILYAALEVHVTQWLSFVPEIQWPPGFMPFLPWPSVGLGVAFTLPGGPGVDPFQASRPAWGARELGSPVR